ncbi:MAG: tRNA (guanosine(46)-N7)-methyltransferase TrmB, partial [Gammaproteobacteria bacterium]|nr:tRNA (guanosine(46)-N7)-methyltransferase TrmB [Gammaproteobacteria bacterium]
MNNPTDPRARPVRSFVRRDSRITPAQEAALAAHWPQYGVDDLAMLAEPERLFGRRAPLLVEIGCGNGACLAALAAAHPAWNCLG